jgi:hypothetical protein
MPNHCLGRLAGINGANDDRRVRGSEHTKDLVGKALTNASDVTHVELDLGEPSRFGSSRFASDRDTYSRCGSFTNTRAFPIR